MIDPKDIKNAALEAIYWWNRTEGYYHQYFSKIDELYEKEDLFKFFTTKIFEVFLREYSIRRNISSGYKNVDYFLDAIIDGGFVSKVREGEVNAIDIFSGKLKENIITNNKQTRSLLSKVAFLINPIDFSLYDNLSKESLWEMVKHKKECRRYDLDSYTVFIDQTNKLIIENSEVLENQRSVLGEFHGTDSFKYFDKNPGSFKRRIFDKYLWLRKINRNTETRKICNNPYKDIIGH